MFLSLFLIRSIGGFVVSYRTPAADLAP